MKIIDIISSSRKVLNTTFSLFLSGSHAKSKTTLAKCMDVLKELKSIMRLVISYLLRDFENYKLVTRNNKNCSLLSKQIVQSLLRIFSSLAKQGSL